MARSGCVWVAEWACVLLIASGLSACGGKGGKPETFNALPNPVGPAEQQVGSLVGPEGLCFDSRGNLYAGSTTGRITRLSPDGTRLIIAETSKPLAGLACGPNDEVYAAAIQAGEVLGIARDGTQRIVTSGLDSPNGLVFDQRQRLIVSASGLAGRPEIAQVELDGTFRTLSRDVTFPNGLAFGLDERLYIAETTRNRVIRMDYNFETRELGPPEVFATGIALADGLAFDQSGDLFIAGNDKIVVVEGKAQEDGVVREFVFSGDVDGPASVAFGFGPGRDKGQLFFTNYGFPSFGSGTSVASVIVGIPGQPLFAP